MDVFTDLGPTAIAKLVGCRVPSVVEWRHRGIPPDRCVALERATEGRHTCESMRRDLQWVRVPDPAWVWHPAGKPLLDVSAVREQRNAA